MQVFSIYFWFYFIFCIIQRVINRQFPCCLLYQCAILSPNFRVRDFAISDAQPYPISLSWQGAMDDEG